MTDLIEHQAAIDALETVGYDFSESELSEPELVEVCEAVGNATQDMINIIKQLPSAQPEWNNHTVACLLAELFDDTCACNYNGIDEWLPEKCEVIDSCPDPAGVACWEQFLKYRAEKRGEESDIERNK